MRRASSIRAAHLASGEHRLKIDFLEPFAVTHTAVDVTDEQDHRLRILHRHVDAYAGIGGAGAARDEADAGFAGHRPVSAGHERGAALLTADDSIDFRRIVQRVEHGKKALARHCEDAVAALGDQAIHQQAAAGHGLGLGHGAMLAAPWALGNAGRVIGPA